MAEGDDSSAKTKTPSKKKSALLPGDSRLYDFWEGLKGWRNLVVIAIVGGIFWGGSRVDSFRPVLAEAVSVLFPLLCVGYLLWEERTIPDRFIKRASMVLGALVVVGAEVLITQAYHPPGALDTQTLSPAHPDATFQVAGGPVELIAQSRGKLLSPSEPGSGSFAVVLRRGTQEQALSGEFSRIVGQSRAMMRRMAPTRTVTTTEVVRDRVSFTGTGPVQAHLDTIDGSIQRWVRVSLVPVSGLLVSLQWALIALSGLGLVLEVIAARRKQKVPIFAALSAASFIGVYIPLQFDPDDPLSIVAGGVIAAVGACVLGGFLLGRVAVFLFASEPSAKPAAKPGGRSRGK